MVYIKIYYAIAVFNTYIDLAHLNSEIRNNLVFIFLDDMRHLTDKDVSLSNIQKLAAEGIHFENAFAQQALCAPSRNSILTGRRPDALRLYDFYSYWRDSVGNYVTFPELFKKFGYETYSVGKVFHPGQSSNFSDDYPHSWSEMPYHAPTEKYKNAAVCRDKQTKELKKNLICPIDVKKQPGKTLPDKEILEHAIDILKRQNSSKPYLLAVGFHKPHIPLKYPKKYLARVSIKNVRPPKHPQMPKKMPIVAWHPWMDIRKRDDIKSLNISYPMGTMPKNWSLKIKQSYFAASLYIDDLLGQLLNAIDKSRTIIVLTSDHGWSLGENGLWAKYSNFEVALKIPLIFSVPGMTPRTVSDIVESVDIYPTLVELARLNTSIPKCKGTKDKSDVCRDGKSLVPYMFNKTQKKSFAISQFPRPCEYPQKNSDKPRLRDITIMGYSMRTKRYRYTEWVEFNNILFTRNWSHVYGVELYDHVKDTDEFNNLYFDPTYERVKKKLAKLLRHTVEYF